MSIVANKLFLSLGEKLVLTGVSATLGTGSITAICGPNGAGKSSLLRVLAGLEQPVSGDAQVDGTDITTMPAKHRARLIGYLPQMGEVAWDLSVRNLVSLGKAPLGDASDGAIDAILAEMELLPLANRPVSQLSGGERARALLARVLAGDPRWILADEPLASLDLGHQLSLLRHLRRRAVDGAGVVLVLHDLALAMNHADHVIVLDKGGVARSGPPGHALSETVIAQVWGVNGRWLGGEGNRTFAFTA